MDLNFKQDKTFIKFTKIIINSAYILNDMIIIPISNIDGGIIRF